MEDTPQNRMSDHTDGLEAAATGKKRMLQGHAGPQGKRSKNEERGLNLVNASGVATAQAPHPSAAKKPRKAPALCEHQRRKDRCKECGGGSICEHQRRRSTCKDCGGSGICEHQRERSRCKYGGGGSICEHQRVRSRCKDCGGSSILNTSECGARVKTVAAAVSTSTSDRGTGAKIVERSRAIQ